MYLAERIVLTESIHPQEYALAQRNTLLAKQLYNAAMFRLRQTFTGWEKENRTENEKEVFDELQQLREAYPSLGIGRVLSYRALEKLMRVTRNPDFFAGLPMQSAQAVVKAASADFGNWLAALKEYRKNPSKFFGRPRMPHYCKNDRKSFTISNQDSVLYPVCRKTEAGEVYAGMELKLPGIRHRLQLPHLPEGSILKETKVCPYYGKFVLILVLETEDAPMPDDLPHMAGLDLGTDNIAAIVTTDHASRVYKGGAVLSQNRLFHKERAKALGVLTKGTKHANASSKHLARLSRKHDCCMRDAMHKISTDIIRYCLEHRVGTLVIGMNGSWKQNADMGKVNNQTFVSVPHAQLRWMLIYKAQSAGIKVILQEESYTSKADVTSADPMPAYGKEDGTSPVFSGKRVSRGTYRCADGMLINADCNGAANILRKAFPECFDGTASVRGARATQESFRFLAHPESVNLKALNRQRAAV